jgi:hypothetical protein
MGLPAARRASLLEDIPGNENSSFLTGNDQDWRRGIEGADST